MIPKPGIPSIHLLAEVTMKSMFDMSIGNTPKLLMASTRNVAFGAWWRTKAPTSWIGWITPELVSQWTYNDGSFEGWWLSRSWKWSPWHINHGLYRSPGINHTPFFYGSFSSKPRWTTGYTPIWLAFGHNTQVPEPLSFGLVVVGESEDPDMDYGSSDSASSDSPTTTNPKERGSGAWVLCTKASQIGV